MNSLDEALRYLEAGLKPIPVQPGHKCPGDAHGMWGPRHPSQKDWSTFQRRAPTTDELERWFTDDGVGVGTVIPSGWVVLDFDGGKDAEKLLTDAGVVLPESTPRVMSGSGGYHAYFKLPAGVRDFAKVPGAKFLHAVDKEGKPCKPFVEVLTINNFVVLPPTIHPNGKPYQWVTEFEDVPTVPTDLMALIDLKRGATPAASAGRAAAAKGNEPGWVEELSKGTGPHTHDDSMTKLAGHYLKKRLSVANVIDILESGYARRSWNLGAGGVKVFNVIKRSDIERVVNSVFRAESRKDVVDESEFQALGYDHELYYYMSRATGQVVELTARNHDKHNLLRLASLRYWEQHYGGEHGINWAGAQAALMERQHKVGVFDNDRFRGRGAWWDADAGAVMHTGTHLVVAGKSTPIKELSPGRNVYELSTALDVSLGDPLPVSEAEKLLALMERFQWEHPHHARLAAGWCVVAAVCGAVEWRPHLWLSGPSGTGKSWVVDNVFKPLLGRMSVVAQSTTTEAGIRQKLGHDARPVVFDEAEAQGGRDDSRMANVLGLMRQASSETGGAILKGAADGLARSFMIRSCFVMSSINVSAYQTADRNRITILEMRPTEPGMPQTERDEKFERLSADVAALLTDEYCASFRSRCIKLIPVIRENARLFAVAASGEIGSRRLGDQIGAMLAGCYSLLSDSPVTPQDALALVRDQDLSQQKELRNEVDELDMLNHILQSVIRVTTSHGAIEASVAACVAAANGEASEANPLPVNARDSVEALSLVGIKATEAGLVVANSHKGVRRLLEGTHWGKDWGRVLLRIVGAKLSGVVRIGSLTARGVVVPWEKVR